MQPPLGHLSTQRLAQRVQVRAELVRLCRGAEGALLGDALLYGRVSVGGVGVGRRVVPAERACEQHTAGALGVERGYVCRGRAQLAARAHPERLLEHLLLHATDARHLARGQRRHESEHLVAAPAGAELAVGLALVGGDFCEHKIVCETGRRR